jgi:hypothetical protein
MGESSCSEGPSGSNTASEYILKDANQAKKIAKLEGDLNSLQSLTKTQENAIEQLQTTVSGSYACRLFISQLQGKARLFILKTDRPSCQDASSNWYILSSRRTKARFKR